MTDREAILQQRRQERLKQNISQFKQQFGQAHLDLAYQAAFSLTLTPELLYLLWANFQKDIQGNPLNIPRIAVADLLLSSLCQQVRYELYQMDPAIRQQFLNDLRADARFGQDRLNQLAEFLLLYVKDQLHSSENDQRDGAESQCWTALAYTKPDEATRELAQVLQARILRQATSAQTIKDELMYLLPLMETLADPLREYGFEPLLVNARGMARGDRGAKEALSAIVKQIAQPTTLDLSKQNLTSLPLSVCQMGHLQSLNLSHNQLTELPPEIGQLVNLVELNLNDNQLTELPPEIGQLVNLVELNLSHNQLTALPPKLGQLKGVVKLNLDHNSLTTLPRELFFLKNLRLLNLSHNQLVEIPSEIENLVNLEVLSLDDNKLKSLPQGIKNLAHLQELFLRHNPLSIFMPTDILEDPQKPAAILEAYFNNKYWVTIPAGEFTMGSDDYSNEKPIHQVDLPEYHIARVPVTNEQWLIFLKESGYQWANLKRWGEWLYKNKYDDQVKADLTAFENLSGLKLPAGKESHPVVYVTWRDAMAFCEWAGVRLPTEAEWEKAARGTDGRKYPWGNEKPTPKICNFSESKLRYTTPVGSYPGGASPYGCLDMAGNVWEWCSSEYKPYPYKADDGREDLTNVKNVKVRRGGSWLHDANNVRACDRHSLDPNVWYDDLGFRCCVSLGMDF